MEDIKGFTLGARDGEIGRIKDFYFDAEQWVLRYFVANTGQWLPSRKVLISPMSVRGVADSDKLLNVELTKGQIENSPSIDHDKPVSRQFESEYYRYYNYPYYWQGSTMWGPLPRPAGSYGQVTGPLQQTWPPPEENAAGEPKGDPHLHSAAEVSEYRIHATNGEIGHVEDFVVDDQDWSVKYLVIDTRNWWPGKKVLISPRWAREVDWSNSRVRIDVDRETIKSAPEYDMSKPISREYEHRLHQHYQQPPYWEHREAA